MDVNKKEFFEILGVTDFNTQKKMEKHPAFPVAIKQSGVYYFSIGQVRDFIEFAIENKLVKKAKVKSLGEVVFEHDSYSPFNQMAKAFLTKPLKKEKP